MHKAIRVLALSATAAFIAGCGAQKDTLHIYSWEGYFSPDVMAIFEAENNCRVKVDVFDSNESMLAKISSGASGYDIIVPSSYMVVQLSLANMIEKIDHSRIPNIKNIDPVYLTKCALDTNMTYSVPLMTTTTGIAWRKDNALIPEEPEHSWSVFEKRSDLAGRMTVLADIRETIGSALIYNGFSINSTNINELEIARDTLIKWKKNVAKFDSESYFTSIANGEFLMVQGYNGNLGQTQLDENNRLAPDHNNIEFFLPKEGYSLACDEMAIPVTAPNKDLAYKFINFIHDAKNAAINEQFSACWCPNAAAKEWLRQNDPTVLENTTIFTPEADLDRAQVLDYLGDALRLYTKIWDEVLSADAK